MNLRQIALAVVLTGVSGAAATAQTPQEQLANPKTVPSEKDSARAEAYYNFTMGHIYEQQRGIRHQGDRGVQESVCARSQIAGHRRTAGGDVLEGAADSRCGNRSPGNPETRPGQRAIAAASGSDLSAEPGGCQRGQRPAGNGEPRHRAVPRD